MLRILVLLAFIDGSTPLDTSYKYFSRFISSCSFILLPYMTLTSFLSCYSSLLLFSFIFPKFRASLRFVPISFLSPLTSSYSPFYVLAITFVLLPLTTLSFPLTTHRSSSPPPCPSSSPLLHPSHLLLSVEAAAQF